MLIRPQAMMSQTRMMGRDAEAMRGRTAPMRSGARSIPIEGDREARPTARPLIDVGAWLIA
jgi:hypothetical protein